MVIRAPFQQFDKDEQLRQLVEFAEQTSDGKLNTHNEITLTASTTSTTLNDSRIGELSDILFIPRNANGYTAQAFPSSLSAGTATISHASLGADTTLGYLVLN